MGWQLIRIGWRWAIRKKGYRTSDGHSYCYYRDSQFRIRKWWRKSSAERVMEELNDKDCWV